MLKKITLLLLFNMSFTFSLPAFAEEIPINVSNLIETKSGWTVDGTTFPNIEISIGEVSTKSDKNGYFILEEVPFEDNQLLAIVKQGDKFYELAIASKGTTGKFNPPVRINQNNKAKETKQAATKQGYELIDDVAVFTDDSDLFWSEKGHVKNFSYDMALKLKDSHEKLDNGAIFRSVKVLIDSYGNETPTNVIIVYLTQETIEEINFDNWPNSQDDLYNVADAYWSHGLYTYGKLNDTKSGAEFAPDLYYDLIMGMHTE